MNLTAAEIKSYRPWLLLIPVFNYFKRGMNLQNLKAWTGMVQAWPMPWTAPSPVGAPPAYTGSWQPGVHPHTGSPGLLAPRVPAQAHYAAPSPPMYAAPSPAPYALPMHSPNPFAMGPYTPGGCTPLLYKPMYSLIVNLSIIIIITNLH